MTTSYYRVAYPHPLLRPLKRCCLCDVGPRTDETGLLAQLYEKYPDSIDDLKRATLWKASDLNEADAYDKSTKKVYDWIDRQNDDAVLPSGDFIVESFPDGPHEDLLDKVDIVVVTPEILEVMHGDAGELRYIKARDEASIGIQRVSAPSDCVKSPDAVRETLSGPHGPRYGRSSDRFGPPTALFSKPLALLKHELDHLESLTPNTSTLSMAFQLIATSTDFYDDEKLRETALRSILQMILPDGIRNRTAEPDGAWLEGIFTYLILVLKNEQGLNDDPFLRGLTTYGKIVSRESYRPYLKRSNLPVILLAIAGNRLAVSTAIFNNEVYADELLSITLRSGTHASKNVFLVARVFMAINKSKREFCDLYKRLRYNPPSFLSPAIALWPNPTTDPPMPISKLEFFAKVDRASGKPLLRIDEENERHAMYLARMQIKTSTQAEVSIQEVFVKFSTQYHEGAHRLLANQDPPLAPTLHFCARVVGDMYMVIMEYIPQSMGRSVDPYFSGPVLPRNLPQIVKRDISKALNLLHEENWVFGDLRESNMLYLPDSDGGRVLLIDFDAVGVDGEARYSACLNPETGFCASVQRGQIMKKEHDFGNLEDVLRRLTKAMDHSALTRP